VLIIAGCVAAVLLVTSGRPGFFGDELYFLAAGQRLDWSYADQPPLVPLLARAMEVIFDGSLTGLRLPSLILTVLGILVTAQIARELGGDRGAQVLAAAAYPTSSFLLSTGHLLYTATVDVFLWAVLSWLLVRWVRTRDDRALLWAGLATALALQAKYLIVALCAALLAGVLVAGPRDVLRRPLLWVGTGIAAASAVPSLVWQARHGWPQLRMGGVISGQNGAVGRLLLLPQALLAAGLLVGAVLVCYGLWRLFRSPELRDYRFLGWACILVAALFVVAGGRSYYVAGLFPLLWAVAAVELRRHRPRPWWRWVPTWPVYALSAAFAVTALPVIPASWQATSIDPVAVGSYGWPELADAVAASYQALPAEQRRETVLVAQTYWEASALDWFGPARGLPPVFSGNQGFAYFGAPPERSGPVLFVGQDPAALRPYFTSLRQLPVAAESIGSTHTVWLCEGRNRPWSEIWLTYRDL
jgi:4-amino-4-deoxy-L-arabinose transferase-like glycosyltransferase